MRAASSCTLSSNSDSCKLQLSQTIPSYSSIGRINPIYNFYTNHQSSYDLRFNRVFEPPFCNTTSCKCSFFPNVIDSWNLHHVDTQNQHSRLMFKKCPIKVWTEFIISILSSKEKSGNPFKSTSMFRKSAKSLSWVNSKILWQMKSGQT
jgi:hypothetical protein